MSPFTSTESQEVENDLEQRLEAKGIDPATIITIVEAVLGLIANCRNPQSLSTGMRSPGRLERTLVRRQIGNELREHGQAVDRRELDRLTDAVLAASAEADDANRQRLVDYCTQYGTF